MTQLIKYDAARKALTEAKSVDEVKNVRDMAAAMGLYARMANDRQMEADAVEIRMRAERRLGEMMKQQAETVGTAKGTAGQGRPSKGGVSKTPPNDGPATLAEAGIDKNLAKAARKAAKQDAKQFEEGIKTMRSSVGGKKRDKKKAKHRTAGVTESKTAMAKAVIDDGKTLQEVANEFGISSVQVVKVAVAEERGRREGVEEKTALDPALLSASAQEKLNAAIRQHKKKLDAEFQQAVTEKVLEWGRNLKFPQYEKYLADAKRVLESRTRGIMSAATYRLIERCLHPDTLVMNKDDPERNVTPERLNNAFIAFQNCKVLVTSHAEMPIKTPGLPTWQEMMAAREARRAENSARSKAAAEKRAAARRA